MRVGGLQTPPELAEKVSWRQLWLGGAFTQLQLLSDSSFAQQARKRGCDLGIGQRPLGTLDQQGVLRPVAFTVGHVWQDVVNHQPYEHYMVFRDENVAAAWSTYAWRQPFGRLVVTPLYRHWQLLYVDQVAAGGDVQVNVGSLLATGSAKASDRLREFLDDLHAQWQAVDTAWRPLIKLLVRLQSRYLPEVTNRLVLPFDGGLGRRVDVWPDECERFDSEAILAKLGLTVEQVQPVYDFLVERGLEREPHDGLEAVRRARSRRSHTQWRGPVRSAQDHFDAAELVRRFKA